MFFLGPGADGMVSDTQLLKCIQFQAQNVVVYNSFKEKRCLPSKPLETNISI